MNSTTLALILGIVSGWVQLCIGAESLNPEQIYQKVLPSVMTIQVDTKDGRSIIGSAFLTLKPGLAVTAWHVVKNAKTASAKFSDGELFEVSGLVDKDVLRDLALVRVKVIDRPFLALAATNAPIGARVYVIGAPRGYEFSISDGLVSQIQTVEGFKQYQFSCPASPGNSGGPLVSQNGEVIGVVCWSRIDSQNLNFATPASYAAGLDSTLPTTPWGAVVPPTELPKVNVGGREARGTGNTPKEVISDEVADKLLAECLTVVSWSGNVFIVSGEVTVKTPGAFRNGVLPEVYRLQTEEKQIHARVEAVESKDEQRNAALRAFERSFENDLKTVALHLDAIHAAQSAGTWAGLANDLLSKSLAQGQAYRAPTNVAPFLWSQPTIVAHLSEETRDAFGRLAEFGNLRLGIVMSPWNTTFCFKVQKDSLAEVLGIKDRDKVLAVDGSEARTLIDVKRAIVNRAGQKLEIRVLREGKEKTLKPTVPTNLDKYRKKPPA